MAGCSDDDGEAGRSSTTSSTTSSTAAAPSGSSTSTPASTDDDAARQAFVEGDLRFLTPPDRPTTRAVSGRDCAELVDAGWQVADCGRVTSPLGDAVWLHERNGNRERALVYVREGNGWRLAQRASDDTGREFDLTAEAVDLVGDGAQKIVFRFEVPQRDPTLGESAPVVADVVESSGAVVVHVVASYPRGKPTVRATAGRGLEVWDCVRDCVSTAPYRYRRISFAESRWKVVEERTADRPPSG